MLSFGFLALGCSRDPGTANALPRKEEHRELRAAMRAVEPFFQPMGKPQQHDWLTVFKEPGQTFDEYIASDPTLPTNERAVIYVQPLGRFSQQQTKVINVTSEYMAAFYGLRVSQRTPRPLPAKLAEPDQRMIDYPQHRQIRTGWAMDAVLKPALPNDAAALIAFTNEDVYSDASMYFVFGQASLESRVGIWSLYRLDDQADFDRFLERALKIAVHEVGHMFSIRHCTRYECVMSGTNHLGETDRRPIDGIDEAAVQEGVTIFHAGTSINEAGAVVTSGGRVLGVTAVGSTLDEALSRAYQGVANISWNGMQYRRDIGR